MKEVQENGKSKRLVVHRISTGSTVNGPGIRAVVWTQGCSIGCPGCFNPLTHTSEPHDAVVHDADELGRQLASLPVDGLTVSGGEPLDQPLAVAALIEAYRSACQGTVFLFTGYTIEHIKGDRDKCRALLACDAVLAGPYVPGRLWAAKSLLNVSGRIPPEHLAPHTMLEAAVKKEGEVLLTGYPNSRHKAILNRLL